MAGILGYSVTGEASHANENEPKQQIYLLSFQFWSAFPLASRALKMLRGAIEIKNCLLCLA